jgi:hypothetical protein
VNVQNKPTFITRDRKLGIALLAQYGQLKELGETKDKWTGVNVLEGALKESLVELAKNIGISDFLSSEKVDTNLNFQFVKGKCTQGRVSGVDPADSSTADVKGLIDHLMGITELKYPSGRQCTIVAGPCSKF